MPSPSEGPRLECDLIMKGGITSGIVYPLAVTELAKTYRFVNIGGTSAGAIAASLTAAAEFARRSGHSEGFAHLAELPSWLGQRSPKTNRSNLFGLFQPSTRTGRIFSVLSASLNRESLPGRVFAMLGAAGLHYPLGGTLGATAGLVVVLAGLRLLPEHRLLAVLVLLLGGLLAIGGWVVGAITGMALNVTTALPGNGFGLCSGMGANGGTPALTEWLATLLDKVAALSGDSPLTFGDLRKQGINLEMLTTNLTQGRPYRVPLLHRSVAALPPTDDHTLYFDPREWAHVFPPRILEWVRAHAGPCNDPSLQAAIRRAGVLPLPTTDDLPVVVAARLSLSFPFLLSAVPLWAFDFSRTHNQTDPNHLRPNAAPDRCWFSDGGITSNFPVHFFDSQFPTRPTFALNLGPFHPDHPQDLHNECNNIYRPHSNSAGQAESWATLPTEGANALGAFLGSILNTMRNWRDNMQVHVPGYRDRIVLIHLNDVEGGLNLDMQEPAIAALARRGACAGKALQDAFGTPARDAGHLSAWDNHRWIRYRTTMLLLEDALHRLSDAYLYEDGLHPAYRDLLQVLGTAPPYPWPHPGQQAFAQNVTAELVQVWQRWNHRSQTFLGDHPLPVPELRIVPRI